MPAGWRVEEVVGERSYPGFHALAVTVYLRHVSNATVKVTIHRPDEWAWVEDHLLPAIAALPYGERPDWYAEADRVEFAT